MLNIIKQKIKNKEGMILLNNDEWITAKEWDKRTDPNWDKTLEDYKNEDKQIDIDLEKDIIRTENNSKLNNEKKRRSIRDLRKNYRNEKSKVSAKLIAGRKARNSNYKYWQKIGYKYIPIPSDYRLELKKNRKESNNPDDYDLILINREVPK